MTEQLNKIRKKLKHELYKGRYWHTMGVMYTASCLAMRHGGDPQQAMLAGLLHDCAKCIPGERQVHLCKKNHIHITEVERKNPFLLHSKLGAFLAHTEYGVKDGAVLHAIQVHTTGAPDMSLLDKIIFVSDYIEPGRDKAPGLPLIRELAFLDIDGAALRILHDTMHYLNQKKGAIDPRTKEAYKFYLTDRNRKENLDGIT